MEIGRDWWKFGLSYDEVFDEEVLIVFVNDRWNEIDDDNDDDFGEIDIRVFVFLFCREDWELYVKRFFFFCLFLDCVKLEIGILLIGV